MPTCLIHDQYHRGQGEKQVHEVLHTVPSCVSHLILRLVNTEVAIHTSTEPFPPDVGYLETSREVFPAYGAFTDSICLCDALDVTLVSPGF